MYSNYHTHTFRCGHATGTEEEYINTAINGGIKIMGFSDHVPFMFEDGNEYFWHVPVNDATDYIETLSTLSEKYKDDIKIHIGFEMEYLPNYFEQMLLAAKEMGAEYLILGQHFSRHETFEDMDYSSSTTNTEENLINYTNLVIDGIKTGVFSCVAHPDLLRYDVTAPEYTREAKRLCKAAKEYDIPLELNFLGIYEGRNYPNDVFWKIVAEVGNKVIFGLDAHNADRAFDQYSLTKATEMVENFGLNLIDELELKPL